MTISKRALLPLAATLLMGCLGGEQPRTLCNATEGEYCDLGEADVATCSFDGVDATASSSCLARWALYDKLCERGSAATVEEVEEGMVCNEVDTGS